MSTVFMGALVAGLDAGLIYNTWPYMGEEIVPPDTMKMEPKWRNFFDNSTTVQFIHRFLETNSFFLYN